MKNINARKELEEMAIQTGFSIIDDFIILAEEDDLRELDKLFKANCARRRALLYSGEEFLNDDELEEVKYLETLDRALDIAIGYCISIHQ